MPVAAGIRMGTHAHLLRRTASLVVIHALCVGTGLSGDPPSEPCTRWRHNESFAVGDARSEGRVAVAHMIDRTSFVVGLRATGEASSYVTGLSGVNLTLGKRSYAGPLVLPAVLSSTATFAMLVDSWVYALDGGGLHKSWSTCMFKGGNCTSAFPDLGPTPAFGAALTLVFPSGSEALLVAAFPTRDKSVQVTAMRTDTGEIKWNTTVALSMGPSFDASTLQLLLLGNTEPPKTSPAEVPSTAASSLVLLAAVGSTELTALSAADGQQRWQYSLPQQQPLDVVADAKKLGTAATQQGLSAILHCTGSKSRAGAVLVGTQGGAVILLNSSSSGVRDSERAVEVWRTSIGDGVEVKHMALAPTSWDDAVPDGGTGSIALLSTSTVATTMDNDNEAAKDPMVRGQQRVQPQYQGRVVALELDSGAIHWTGPSEESPSTAVAFNHSAPNAVATAAAVSDATAGNATRHHRGNVDVGQGFYADASYQSYYYREYYSEGLGTATATADGHTTTPANEGLLNGSVGVYGLPDAAVAIGAFGAQLWSLSLDAGLESLAIGADGYVYGWSSGVLAIDSSCSHGSDLELCPVSAAELRSSGRDPATAPKQRCSCHLSCTECVDNACAWVKSGTIEVRLWDASKSAFTTTTESGKHFCWEGGMFALASNRTISLGLNRSIVVSSPHPPQYGQCSVNATFAVAFGSCVVLLLGLVSFMSISLHYAHFGKSTLTQHYRSLLGDPLLMEVDDDDDDDDDGRVVSKHDLNSPSRDHEEPAFSSEDGSHLSNDRLSLTFKQPKTAGGADGSSENGDDEYDDEDDSNFDDVEEAEEQDFLTPRLQTATGAGAPRAPAGAQNAGGGGGLREPILPTPAQAAPGSPPSRSSSQPLWGVALSPSRTRSSGANTREAMITHFLDPSQRETRLALGMGAAVAESSLSSAAAVQPAGGSSQSVGAGGVSPRKMTEDEAMFLMQTTLVIRQYKYVLYLELLTYALVFTLFGLNPVWMRIFPDVFVGPLLWLASQYALRTHNSKWVRFALCGECFGVFMRMYSTFGLVFVLVNCEFLTTGCPSQAFATVFSIPFFVLAWYDLGFHVAAIFINLDLSKMLNIHVRGVNSPGGSSNSVVVGFLGRVN